MWDYIKGRFSEPSTWLGLLLGTAEIIKFFTPNDIDMVVDTVVAAVSGLLVVVPDKK